MEDSSLDAKQRYMRERILDAGYDAEQFVEFCSSRHDLEDLENWSMDQLRQIVHDFIHSLQPSTQLHQIPIAEEDKQEFGNFQEPFLHPPSITIPAASNKMGLVFSDDDWNVLLSGPSILNQGKNDGSLNKNIDIPLFTLSLDHLPLQPLAVDNSPKNIPLSPSASNPNLPTLPNKFVPSEQRQQNPKPIEKVQQAHQQKQQKKTGEGNNNPINLSNIKISTAKQKVLPPLPAINDVIVTKTEQVARNFLQSDYTLYHIQFTPSQHTIQRKFTDLRRVRAILQRLYPFLRLPYLEPQGWINSSEGKDPQNLSKYKLMVEQFIKYLIIKSDELKNCELVRTLCGFSSKGDKGQVSKEELKKKLQAYEYIPRPKFIGEVILENNTIFIPPITSGQKLINHTVNLLTEIDLHYDRLKKQLDVLFINYEEIIKSIGEVALTFDSLQNLIKKYNGDNSQLTQVRIFEGLKEMALKLSNRIDTQYGIFKARIKGLFRYQKQNMATLKEVIECRNKINYEYVRRGQPAFTSNKLKLQGQTVEIQSPIALEEPVRNNKNALAVQEIFWSFMCSREIKRYWQHLRRKIGEHLTLIAYDELDSENENLNFWNLIIKKCVI